MGRGCDVGRFILVAVLVGLTGVTAASCGGSSGAGPITGGPDATGNDGPIFMQSDGGGCHRETCSSQGFTCGMNGDGCGGVVDCGSCTKPGEYCGGGGYSQCGNATINGDAGPCTPKTCQDWGFTCGPAGDGCGGMIDCGMCTLPEYCGGKGPSQCGGNVTITADGGMLAPCTPKTCQDRGYTCGLAGDGCGGMIDCGTCTSPAYCGGAGPSKCGGNINVTADGGRVCSPTNCTALGVDCGAQGDGCGGLLQCGSCTAPAYCGGAGPSQCGGNINIGADGGLLSCPPATCQSLRYNCGAAADGCGGLLQCGTCTLPLFCGGGGQPNVCGTTAPCTGLCMQQVQCGGGATTNITGTVRAGISSWLPAGIVPDPVPGVVVYVPNAPLQAFAPNVQCSQCGGQVTGSPLVSTTTNFDGTFTLQNVPVGNQIPVVIQLGRWRREFFFNVTTGCATTAVGDLNMPSNQSQGDIPLTAISTGAVDAIECVLLKMGVDQGEFTTSVATPSGRVHLFSAGPGSGDNNGDGPGAYLPGSRPESTLMGTTTANGTYMTYDQILFPCWGKPVNKNGGPLANLVTYANAGGHFFATHYSYTWLYTNNPFDGTAQWDVNANNNAINTPFTGTVSRTAPPTVPVTNPGTFVRWLNLVGALSNGNPALPPPNPAQVTINEGRHNVDKVLGQSVDWIDGTDPNPNFGSPAQMLLHYTFNTPLGQPNQCGHAIYSDFHVTKFVANQQTQTTNGARFPDECDKALMTSQERILEYMIWDLASCVPGQPTSTCVPKTCAQQGLNCGPAGDGCGNPIPGGCGSCPTGQTCGGGGVASVCGGPDGGVCSPLTCTQQNIHCGPAGNGCGGQLDCGPCLAGQTCGGGGVPNVCGTPDGGACTPQSCMQQNIGCGPAGDGCGNSIPGGCGMCPSGQTCGGAGIPSQCGGGGSCTPETCQQQNITCGPAGDGCGGAIPGGCGTCMPPQSCGGGGVPGQCGGGACVPMTCQVQHIGCGPAGDGCGHLIACGTCAAPQTCGGGGVPGQCGGGNQ